VPPYNLKDDGGRPASTKGLGISSLGEVENDVQRKVLD